MKLKALLSVMLIVTLLVSPVALMEETIEQKVEPDGDLSMEEIIEKAPENGDNAAMNDTEERVPEDEVLIENVDEAVPENEDAELMADVIEPDVTVFGIAADEAENDGVEESDEATAIKETDIENPETPENQSDIQDQLFLNNEAQSEVVELIGEVSNLGKLEAEEADLFETDGITSNYLEDSDMGIDVESSSNFEVAPSVSGEAESGELLATESSSFVPVELSITIDKSMRYALNNGDGLRITINGDLASCSSGKNSVASIDTVEGNTFHVVTHKPGKATITVVLKKRKKIKVNLTVKNPYLPKSVSFVNMPSSLVVGDTLSLNEYIAFDPVYATSSVKWKSSNKKVIRVDKSGNLVALKPGKAKITAKTGNKKSCAIRLTIRPNAIYGLNQRPSKDVITTLGNAFSLWPKSICYEGNNRIVCEFYLLNGTNNRIKFIRNLNLGIYLGEQNNILARQIFSKIKVKGGKKGTTIFKVIFSGGGVLLPNAHLADWEVNQVLFDLDQASVYATAGNKRINFSTGDSSGNSSSPSKSSSDQEASLREKLSSNIGNEGILHFGYADYDGDGTYEAFAIVGHIGDTSAETVEELWYITSNTIKVLERKKEYYPEESEIRQLKNKNCYRISEGYGGSGGKYRFWTVVNGLPYLYCVQEVWFSRGVITDETYYDLP